MDRRRIFTLCAAGVAGLIAINAGLAVAVAASSRHEASAWPGKSFAFWRERTWKHVEGRIRGLPPGARLRHSTIGRLGYRQESFPVHLLRFSAAPRERRPLRVLLVAGVHGTEPAGVEALIRIAEELARDPSRFSAVSLDIVPVVNPWAWVYGYRYNGDGEDVNRDFSSRRTREARIIRKLYDENGPYDLLLDLHESKKPGYFIYQYVSEEEGLGGQYVKLLSSLGRPLENNYREGVFRTTGGILRIPAASLLWISMGGRLSLEQYARLHGTRHAYTVETPLADDFDQRVEVHRRTAEMFISRLAGIAFASSSR